ncbi:hypothetical protein MCOR02_010788 [Pyricularia oryzae]|uniref:Secreted protein n=1 Tax=Pyricularia grisea TaxID=148305 RepID=A0ABQ8NVM4_PYRGI|nr:hypothetical protein MCOR02_010788 [Pyricularia oryzae]KAI6302243.1 hypothetical protein MCOR33_002425 [Pyricularia grisea]KAI6263823.1 hypothetical protein MCOR19_000154 [Pyricularia oryzae]KAI6310067.1 hypothetical protein MCOR30_011197 [Pyricularia oryzae]KAI6323374.1 hypothetical protein MCOR34_001831 [Pyricularia oryzae]
MSHVVTSSASFAAVTALIFLGCRTIPRPPPVVYHIKQHPGKGGGQNVRLSLFPGFKGALARQRPEGGVHELDSATLHGESVGTWMPPHGQVAPCLSGGLWGYHVRGVR